MLLYVSPTEDTMCAVDSEQRDAREPGSEKINLQAEEIVRSAMLRHSKTPGTSDMMMFHPFARENSIVASTALKRLHNELGQP
jgi:hypothetical protein